MHAWVYAVVLAIVLAIGLMYLSRSQTEGFVTVDLNMASAQRQQLQFEGERRYNNFARVQGTNSLIPADQVQAALQQEIPVPTASSNSLMSLLSFVGLSAADDGSGKQGYGVEQTGMVQQKINFCESQVTVDCDLLSDPRFAECGFCHRDGTDSKGKPHRGGLYISSDDQIRANELSNSNGQAPGVYKPTIGSCKPQNFTLMAESCQVKELQMQCQKAGGPTSNNPCGQCFGGAPAGTTGLLYMGPKPRAYTATLWVSHPGSNSAGGAGLAVRYPNGYQVTLPPSNQPLLDPQQLTLTITEGDNLVIGIVGVPAVWCGWLSSPDGMRTVSLDIGDQGIVPATGFMIAGDKNAKVVNAAMAASADPNAWANFQNKVPNNVLWYQRRDEVVPGAVVSAWYGVSPASQGNTMGTDVTAFVKLAAGENLPLGILPEQFNIPDPAPGVQKHLWINQDNGNTIIGVDGQTIDANRLYNAMLMNFTVPATLVNPLFADDMANCPTGPIIFTEVGAGLMGAHSCFKADGSFNPSMYCIQELWAAAGGTPQGTAYPKTDAQAAALALNDASGNPNLDATVAAFNNGVNIAMYGVDMNGAPQEFATIKANALAFLGITMNNPCDGPTSTTGPHMPECLDYLWRTSGNPGQDASTADPSKLPYAYCKADGLAAPLNKDGTVNQANAVTANGFGSVPNVRAYFQGIFNRTQDNSDFDAQAAAMRDCYNVNITPPPEDPAACPLPNPDQWQCFGPTKLAQPEVFQVSASGYTTAQNDAAALCATYGAQVATSAQLITAQQQGADWCSSGWVSDDTEAQFPMNTILPSYGNGCGSVGINKWTPSNNLAAVNCFGKKPPAGTQDILPFTTAGVWRNPTSLPPGITDSQVIVGAEVANQLYCGSPDNRQCIFFKDEPTCQSYIDSNGPILGAVNLNAADSILAVGMDQYLRARI